MFLSAWSQTPISICYLQLLPWSKLPFHMLLTTVNLVQTSIFMYYLQLLPWYKSLIHMLLLSLPDVWAKHLTNTDTRDGHYDK